MPNWCYNKIEMYGDEKELQKIKEQVETKESLFDFDTIIPTPNFDMIPNDKGELPKLRDDAIGKELGIKEFPDGSSDDRWYHWHIDNWGTKWNIEALTEDRISVDKNKVIFDCETAWSPPIEALVELEKKGFEIECDYYEGGCAFIGRYETNAEEKSWSLPETLAELKDMMKDNEVFKDLVESWGVDLDYEEMEREE